VNSAFLLSSIAWLGVRHAEAIPAVRAAGFGGVEVLCKPGHFDYDDDAQVDEVRAALDDWPDADVTFHAPFYGVDLASSDSAAREHAVRETIRALRVASSLRAGSATVHARSRDEMARWDDDNRAAFQESLGQLVSAASEIKLAVENFPPPCFTSDPEDLLRLIEPFPSVGVCIDTGHAHLGGRLSELARLLATRAIVSHIHDNSATRGDEHLIPGEGTIPWNEFVQAMRGFHGRPVMEVKMSGTLGETLDKVKKAMVETGLSGLGRM
jgi:sugar phosphate isomerase/epimerase